MKSELDKIMKPKTIAVIGASTKPEAVGHEIIKKALEFGYKGTIYPINPKADQILGLKVYKSVKDVPGPVDMAVVVVPRDFVFGVIDECAEKNIKALVVITAGYKETGGEGSDLELQLKEKCDKYGMTVVGPNCMGVFCTDPDVMMNATFAPIQPIPGYAAFLSQSGALGIAVLNVAKAMNIGLSQFVSMGNKMDINENHLLEYWAKDERTKLLLMYIESFEDPKKFREMCTQTAKTKPVVVIKSGTSDKGAAAASSHTGALAGADIAASAMLSQCGVIREKTMLQMFEITQIFANCPLPKSNKIAILTNAGGPGIMCTDAAIAHGLDVVKLDPETTRKLKELLPPQASTRNPVDTIAAVTVDMYEKSLHLLLQDPNVDTVISMLVPLVHITGHDIARVQMKAQQQYKDKPIVSVIMATDDTYKEIYGIKDLPPIPFFTFPENAAYALSRVYEYAMWKNKPLGKFKDFSDVDRSAVERIVSSALSENRDMLTTLESMDILKAYGVRTCKYAEAKDAEDAVTKANEIGYPVVMKILSKSVSHKSDVGGVVVNIQNADQLRKEYTDLMNRAKEHNVAQFIHAVMIQEMIKGKREIVIGSSKDPQFGSMLMFGLGGIFIEALKDVIFKINPITDQDAEDMITSINSYKLIKGYRGLKGADLEYLKDQLMRLSQLIADFGYIDELDINPYIITDDTGEPMAVDGRIKLGIKTREEMTSYKTCAACK